MRINNLDRIKFVIRYSTIISLCVVSFLSIGLLVNLHHKYEVSKGELAKQRIYEVAQNYVSTISEKLSIIASSDVFINYVQSGNLSRSLMYPDFISELSLINSPAIVGMQIQGINEKLAYSDRKLTDQGIIFSYGEISGYPVNLKLYYLGGKLGAKFGRCKYLWTLYLNKDAFISEIKAKNHNIKDCQYCEKIKIFNGDYFGSFPLASNPDISVQLTINDEGNNLLLPFGVVTIIFILLFAIWNNYWVNYIVDRYINVPLRDIVNRLRNDESFDGVKNIIEEIGALLDRIKTWREERAAIEVGEIAKLLAHDIRSPLIALEGVADKFESNDENAKLLRKIAARITDIANSFLNLAKSKVEKLSTNSKDDVSVNLIFPLIEKVVSEKRLQLDKTKCILQLSINPNARFACVNLNASNFMRVLSNILDNAIEALVVSKNGELDVILAVVNRSLKLEIIDNGCGIAENNLEYIFDEGFTYNKSTGSGLGLYYAKKVIVALKGTIKVSSELSVGTSVIINLPLAPLAPWLVDTCVVHTHFCVVDDEENILDVFNKLLMSIKQRKVTINYFKQPEEFLKQKDKFVYSAIFIDNTFKNSSLLGINIVSKMTNYPYVYLITNDYDCEELIKLIQSYGIKMIPKPCLSQVKFVEHL